MQIMEMQRLIERINLLKEEMERLRPLDPEIEKRVMQKFRLDWNYHSSKIEGNSLTFGETKTFLLHGLTADGKPLRDHLEIRGHNKAVLELQSLINQEGQLTEHIIRGLHQIILGSEPYQIPARTPEGRETHRWVHPGRYKKEPNHVRTATGEIFYFATPEETEAKMEELMEWYRHETETSELPSLIFAALFHYRFILIHPFDDGNGRIARILMNLVLMSGGYPPVVIRTEEKEEYYRALRQADGGDLEKFTAFIGQELIRSLELYLKGARGEEINGPDDLDRQIELFKATIEKSTERENLLEKTEERAAEAVRDNIVPLLELLDEKLSRFDELFNSKEYRWSEWLSVSSYKEGIDVLSKALKGSNRSFSISIYWFCFTGKPSLDITVKFEFACRKYDYAVSWQVIQAGAVADSIARPYGENFSERDRQRVAREVVRLVMEAIEERHK